MILQIIQNDTYKFNSNYAFA